MCDFVPCDRRVMQRAYLLHSSIKYLTARRVRSNNDDSCLLIELKCLHWSLSCFRGFELIKPATFVARFIQHDCLFLVSLDSLFRTVRASRPTLIDLAYAMGTGGGGGTPL